MPAKHDTNRDNSRPLLSAADAGRTGNVDISGSWSPRSACAGHPSRLVVRLLCA